MVHRLVPVRAALPDGTPLVLRPLRRRDQREWLALRVASLGWVGPWEPTPVRPGQSPRPYRVWLRGQRAETRAGRLIPWAVEVDGRLVGAVTLSQVFEGALFGAQAGYWVAPHVAGRGIAPLALALACDDAVATRGLHRIELVIRPDNEASLAVARKLGFRDEGVRRRYLHIAGAWRDHRAFALTTEDLGGGTFVERLRGRAIAHREN